MKKTSTILSSLALVTMGLMTLPACKDEKVKPEEEGKSGDFHVAFAVGSDSESSTYVQGLSDLSTGNISFEGYGFELPSTRTARFFASTDGKFVYNLDYGGGLIYRFEYKKGEEYVQTNMTDVSVVMGTANPRWTKVNDQYALLHNVLPENHYADEAGTIFEKRTTKTILAVVDMSNMSIITNTQFEMPMPEDMVAENYFVSRIDAPVILGGKAYYGVAYSKYNPSEDKSTANYINTLTLVVDFPSLENPKLIKTDIAKGATNGYRTPNAHIDENNNIYVISDNGKNTTFLQIKDGAYTSYKFDFSAAIGRQTSTQGWFYVGNGIGYLPYLKADLGAKADPYWGVARIDLNSKTVVDLNVPDNLWLQQYQYSVMKNGIFYMALSPVGGEGNIYKFDINSTSPNGFEKGATIKTGADAYYIGIF